MPSAFRFISAISLPLVLTLAAVAPVAAVDLTQQCSNTDDGYSVSLPRGWYYNERVEGGELDDVAACRFFGPEDFAVTPQGGIGGMAIAIGLGNDGPPGEMTPDTTVDGKPAFVTETTVAEDGIEPAGTRHYDYWIEIGPDAWLVAETSDAPNFTGDYDENKIVLDAMMDSLRFRAASRPSASRPSEVMDWSPTWCSEHSMAITRHSLRWCGPIWTDCMGWPVSCCGIRRERRTPSRRRS